MKKRTALIILIITALCLSSCGKQTDITDKEEPPTASSEVGEIKLNLSPEWQKVDLNKTQDATNYSVEYKKGNADIRLDAIYVSEFGDLQKIEKTICSEYKDPKDEIVKIDGEEGVKYTMERETRVHLTTDAALYVLSYVNSPDAPESIDDIIKNITLDMRR